MNKFESDFLKLAYPIGILCAIGCTLVAYSLTVAWTNSSDVDLGVTYIGIPDWNNNVLAWHPVMMVCGFFFCQVLAAATWYIKSDPSSILFNPTNTKRIHGLLQLGALGSLITGIYAIYQATLIPEPQPALTSIHSWVGTAAIALYMVNFLLAIVREVVKYCSDMAKPNVFLTTSIHVHRFLGLLALLSTSSAIVTGIMDFNGSNCDYVVTDPDNNPAQHYGIIPTGCQISNGIGISVLIGTNLLAAAIWCKWVNNEDVKDIPTQEYDEFTRQQVESFEKDHKSVGLIPAP